MCALPIFRDNQSVPFSGVGGVHIASISWQNPESTKVYLLLTTYNEDVQYERHYLK